MIDCKSNLPFFIIDWSSELPFNIFLSDLYKLPLYNLLINVRNYFLNLYFMYWSMIKNYVLCNWLDKRSIYSFLDFLLSLFFLLPVYGTNDFPIYIYWIILMHFFSLKYHWLLNFFNDRISVLYTKTCPWVCQKLFCGMHPNSKYGCSPPGGLWKVLTRLMVGYLNLSTPIDWH